MPLRTIFCLSPFGEPLPPQRFLLPPHLPPLLPLVLGRSESSSESGLPLSFFHVRKVRHPPCGHRQESRHHHSVRPLLFTVHGLYGTTEDFRTKSKLIGRAKLATMKKNQCLMTKPPTFQNQQQCYLSKETPRLGTTCIEQTGWLFNANVFCLKSFPVAAGVFLCLQPHLPQVLCFRYLKPYPARCRKPLFDLKSVCQTACCCWCLVLPKTLARCRRRFFLLHQASPRCCFLLPKLKLSPLAVFSFVA